VLVPAAVKAWRKERGVSQLELARLAGCSEGLIAQIETIAIATALNVPLAALGKVLVTAADLAGATGAVTQPVDAA